MITNFIFFGIILIILGFTFAFFGGFLKANAITRYKILDIGGYISAAGFLITILSSIVYIISLLF